MSPQIIDGKAIAQTTRHELKSKIDAFSKTNGWVPGLATILVGENPASMVYIKNKIKACQEVGIISKHFGLSESISQSELLDLVLKLNLDPEVQGILVQLPLPKHINAEVILDAILPIKDVDGFHPVNMGNLMIGKPGLKPCTPYGIIKMLEQIKYDLSGKQAVVIGRSNIVGKPMAMLLLQGSATVTICHSKTKNIKEEVSRADLVVAAVGIPEFVRGDWIKQGSTIIDVGINRLESGKLVGDVAYDEAALKAAAITPVPGGVGPMTIAMLLWNTYEASLLQLSLK